MYVSVFIAIMLALSVLGVAQALTGGYLGVGGSRGWSPGPPGPMMIRAVGAGTAAFGVAVALLVLTGHFAVKH